MLKEQGVNFTPSTHAIIMDAFNKKGYTFLEQGSYHVGSDELSHLGGNFVVLSPENILFFVKWGSRNFLAEVVRQAWFNRSGVALTMVRTPTLFALQEIEQAVVATSEYVHPGHVFLPEQEYIGAIGNALREIYGIPVEFLMNAGYLLKTTDIYTQDAADFLAILVEKGALQQAESQRVSNHISDALSNAQAEGNNHFTFVHGDFAPHNFVVQHDKTVILFDLEHSAVGSPYEDIARLVNFYALHHPPLAIGLIRFAPDEQLLNAHRIIKALHLAAYYARKMTRESGNTFVQRQLNYWLTLVNRLVDGLGEIPEEDRQSFLAQEVQLVTPHTKARRDLFTYR